MKRLLALATSLFIASGISGCENKTKCVASCAPFYSDVELLDWNQTLRKASLSIAGRLPDTFEQQVVKKNGQAGLEDVLEQMMKEEPFYDRLKEIYNDVLLTDRYLIDGTMIIDSDRYPTRQFYEQLGDAPEAVASRYGADHGIGREPLNIIAHVVRNDRNFGEILTADYTLVNAYSAQSYGLLDLTFVGNPFDVNNLIEVKLQNHKHAGLLTTPSFLNRFPTSATNRNRHRSRYTYKYFMDVDVLLLGTRPLTTSNIAGDTPTMTDPACVSCHDTVDPLAGLYQSWDDEGRLRPREWPKDMFEPGLAGEKYKSDGKTDPLQWAAQRIIKQPGFVRAAVRTVFKGLTGQDPIGLPASDAFETPEGQAQLAALDAQTAVFNEIGTRFKDSNMNLKVVVKNIILSPYFRAKNVKESADPVRALEYKDLGMGRMLTPEMLNRKVKTMLALDRYWGRPEALRNDEYLISNDQYLIYYGGIDSNTTTTRITSPNGISVNVARRMSNELACRAVALDLSVKKDRRALFPSVDAGTLPENVDDESVEAGKASNAVRENIRYLHSRFLDESLSSEDPEIERTYALFMETLREGRQAVASGEESEDLPNECRGTRDSWTEEEVNGGLAKDPDYTVRAWMAVVSYLMADYKFIYE
jgi:hypothetical protein